MLHLTGRAACEASLIRGVAVGGQEDSEARLVSGSFNWRLAIRLLRVTDRPISSEPRADNGSPDLPDDLSINLRS